MVSHITAIRLSRTSKELSRVRNSETSLKSVLLRIIRFDLSKAISQPWEVKVKLCVATMVSSKVRNCRSANSAKLGPYSLSAKKAIYSIVADFGKLYPRECYRELNHISCAANR